MKEGFQKLGIALVTFVVLASCVNIKHVHEFSSTSLKSIKTFEKLNYSFTKSCDDRCVIENVNNLRINAKECPCKMDKKADSITLKIYEAVGGYFNGLANLSDNELAIYKTENLESTLIEGDFGAITIDKNQVVAYAKVSKLVMRAFTDGYRRGKLKKYIKKANVPVLALLQFLDFNISQNLKGKLKVKKDRLKAVYFDLLTENSLSAFEKRNSIEKYYAHSNRIHRQQQKLEIYSKGLQQIAKGHQKLFDNIDKLRVKEIKQSLFQYASEINLIISEFEKIEK